MKTCLLKDCDGVVKEKRNKYCSRSCSNRARKNTRYCEICNKELKKSQKRFCSTTCQMDERYNVYIERWLLGKETGDKGVYGVQISNHVRRWLHEQRGSVCWQCGWAEINKWTERIPLQVNHIDGDWRNTTPENIELICPNCHSLTEHFGSLNTNGRRRVVEGKQKR